MADYKKFIDGLHQEKLTDIGDGLHAEGKVIQVKQADDSYSELSVNDFKQLPTGAATEAKQDTIIGHVDWFEAAIGEVQATPTANTLLARLKSLEDKIDKITSGTTPAVTTLSGSNVEIGGKTFALSGGDTIRGRAADKPTAAAAHAIIAFCFYFAVDTGVAEVSDGTSWVVI